jgi:alpha-beta hydrolase superfamily lysophospholipase
MGGAVVQKYLASYSAPAGVLLASVPPAGVLAATLRIARRHPVAFAKVNLTLSLFPLVATPQLAREAFFSASMPEQRVQAYAKRMQDESYLAFLDMLMLDLPRPQRVTAPMLVMGAARDTIFHPYEIEATARAYHTQAVVFSDMAHDVMLEADWQAVADRVIAWLTERGI